ncbi:MAG: DegV family protein [Collinsella sp.]
MGKRVKTYVHGYFTLESFDAPCRRPHSACGGAAHGKARRQARALLRPGRGSLSPIGVNRGRKKALKSILKSFRENYVPDRTMPIAIMTADAEKDGDWLKPPSARRRAAPTSRSFAALVGPTIGSHVGPGMVGCAFWGKNRADKASLSDRIARRVRGQ